MYGIYANVGGILMVNVTIYSIHGSYGFYWLYLSYDACGASKCQVHHQSQSKLGCLLAPYGPTYVVGYMMSNPHIVPSRIKLQITLK